MGKFTTDTRSKVASSIIAVAALGLAYFSGPSRVEKMLAYYRPTDQKLVERVFTSVDQDFGGRLTYVTQVGDLVVRAGRNDGQPYLSLTTKLLTDRNPVGSVYYDRRADGLDIGDSVSQVYLYQSGPASINKIIETHSDVASVRPGYMTLIQAINQDLDRKGFR